MPLLAEKYPPTQVLRLFVPKRSFWSLWHPWSPWGIWNHCDLRILGLIESEAFCFVVTIRYPAMISTLTQGASRTQDAPRDQGVSVTSGALESLRALGVNLMGSATGNRAFKSVWRGLFRQYRNLACTGAKFLHRNYFLRLADNFRS